MVANRLLARPLHKEKHTLMKKFLPLSAHRRAYQTGIAITLLTGTIAFGTKPLFALPIQADDKTEYTVQRVFKAKEVDRYKMDIKMVINNPQLGGELNASVDGLLKQTTTEVKDDGTATLETVFEKALANAAGQEIDAAAMMPKTTLTLNKKGELVNMKTDGGEGPFAMIGSMVASMQRSFFPNKPVKVGDTWYMDVSVAAPKGKEKEPEKPKEAPKDNATFVAVETIKGIKTLKVKLVGDVPLPKEILALGDGAKEDKTHIELFGYIDPQNGKLIRLTSSSAAKSGPLKKIELTFALITGDEKDTKR